MAIAPITPRAASHGAITAPINPTVAGKSSSIFPFSSFMIILLTFPSCSSFLTVFTRSSDDTVNSSDLKSFIEFPQTEQKFASSSSFFPRY